MKLLYTFLIIAFVPLQAFAGNQATSVAKEAMIDAQVEFAKAKIDRKCQKVKEKIKALENRMSYIETKLRKGNLTDESFQKLNEKLSRTVNRIKKKEDKIDSLKTMKMSLGAVNFNPF